MEDLKKQIKELEEKMANPTFWEDKIHAQEEVKRLSKLKEKLSGRQKYERGNAIVTIFSGAGGDDAEDFARMLFDMYSAFCEKRKFLVTILHRHDNDHNGIKNMTFVVEGKGAYGTLQYESGVHRLVRTSPFSAKKLRHTSFAMVEVIPKFEVKEVNIPQDELQIEFTKSSGPGGQNVNKRETAVRITHKPTGISVHSDSSRSQSQNKERALEILRGKLYREEEKKEQEKSDSFSVSKIQDAEWGNQIRSYVLHPYKLVKDHRTNVEHKDPERVLTEGDLDIFISAFQ